MFKILLDIPAYTFLAGADETMRSRVKETLEELAPDPVLRGAKRIIESQEKIFRLRSRHLRLLYRVDYENLALVVIMIEPLSRLCSKI
jgi:mRNA-degrading endonuclease RelE of RelBE toxin-antitoxin system